MIEDVEGLTRILQQARIIAVVGLSAQWHRPSYFAASYMQKNGYRVVPVNPAYPEVLGEKSYPDLPAAAEGLSKQGIPVIDVVNCFRKSEEIPPIVDQAIALGAKCVWMQLGVQHEEAARKAEAAGLDVVANRCIKIEHARIFGGLNWAGVNTQMVSSRRSK